MSAWASGRRCLQSHLMQASPLKWCERSLRTRPGAQLQTAAPRRSEEPSPDCPTRRSLLGWTNASSGRHAMRRQTPAAPLTSGRLHHPGAHARPGRSGSAADAPAGRSSRPPLRGPTRSSRGRAAASLRGRTSSSAATAGSSSGRRRRPVRTRCRCSAPVRCCDEAAGGHGACSFVRGPARSAAAPLKRKCREPGCAVGASVTCSDVFPHAR
jgi:hypothetical protein